MSIHYFVRNHDCPERKTYVIVDDILQDIPNFFTLDKDPHTYSIEDVEIEGDDLVVFLPIIILGFIGLLIHPFAGIIGAFIGLIIGLSQIKVNDLQVKKAKENLRRLK